MIQDPRAVARVAAEQLLDSLPISYEPADHGSFREATEAYEEDITIILQALADERRRALEEAAKICHEMARKEGFKNITGTDEEDVSRKSTAWMMDQCAAEIRAKAQSGEEGE